MAAFFALQEGSGASACRVAAEERFRGVAADDGVGDGVGVLFVGVAGLADAAFEVDAASLLDDVGGFVGGGVEVGLGAEGGVVAGGVGDGADGVGGVGGGTADVGGYGGDVVAAEGGLDRCEVGQGLAAARDAGRGGAVDVVLGGGAGGRLELQQRGAGAAGVGLAGGGRRVASRGGGGARADDAVDGEAVLLLEASDRLGERGAVGRGVGAEVGRGDAVCGDEARVPSGRSDRRVLPEVSAPGAQKLRGRASSSLARAIS